MLRRQSVLGISGLVVCAVTSVARGQGPPPDSLAANVDRVFAHYADPSGPGCAVGIFKDGAVLFAKGYGSANLEYGVPITPTTPFIMGSVSKQFTAAAIALLVNEGRLSLDDDVRKYVPELPDYGTKITIGNLVHHTSGLRDFWELVSLAGMRNDDGYAASDVLQLAARQHALNFTPGEKYEYSNTGYIVLGVVVQRVTGTSLRQFLGERIFTPLGMQSSQVHDDHNAIVRGRAAAYTPEGRSGWKIDVWNNDLVGQGGVMTTVMDLAKWDENFYTGAVGGTALLSRQSERGTLNDGSTIPYAFGLEIGEYRGLPMVEHAGSTGGYRTIITRFPTEHTSFVVLCNVSSANTTALSHQMADYVLRDRFPAFAQTTVRGVTGGIAMASGQPPPFQSLTGRYYSDELDATYEIILDGQSLVLRRPRSANESLSSFGGTTFRAPVGVLHFELGADGHATGFVLNGTRVQNLHFVRR